MNRIMKKIVKIFAFCEHFGTTKTIIFLICPHKHLFNMVWYTVSSGLSQKSQKCAIICYLCLNWQCHEIFCQFFFLNRTPPVPLINRLKWFCWKICLRGDIRILSSKNSSPRIVSRRWVKIFDNPVIKNVRLCWNSSHIFFFKFNILLKGKERPVKTKLMPAKLYAVLATFEFSENVNR